MGTPLQVTGVIFLWVGLGLFVWHLLRRARFRGRTRDRVFPGEREADPDTANDPLIRQRFIRRWLFLAGYRGPWAPVAFVAAELSMVAIGLTLVYVFYRMGPLTYIVRGVEGIPGGLGQMLLPVGYLTPWLSFSFLAALPWLVVQSTRRRRVQKIEQDLSISLELLATLSEAGLGFDAGVAHLFDTELGERPLGRELRSFQSDLLAGRTRVESLRRLARRLEVSSVTVLVSALVQAEQMGMGIASVLRRQAEELRSRRREQALAFAMGLSVKRLFPLVICFLPGLFVWTLGPTFAQLFQLADSVLRLRSF